MTGIKTTRRCEKHDIEYEEIEALIAGVHMRFGKCPKCEEEIDDIIGIRGKGDARASLLEALKRDHNIEPMYADCSLDNYVVETDEQAKAKQATGRLIEAKAGKLVLLGNHGTGKTHLGVASIRGLGGKIYTVYEISTRIRATYAPRAQEDELDIVDELAHLPMLVIDEIGRTKGSDAEMNWLSYIIDKRHARYLPIILISNKHLYNTCPRGADGCPDCLENYIGDDIMSRLREDGWLLSFKGEDWRRKKRAA